MTKSNARHFTAQPSTLLRYGGGLTRNDPASNQHSRAAPASRWARPCADGAKRTGSFPDRTRHAIRRPKNRRRPPMAKPRIMLGCLQTQTVPTTDDDARSPPRRQRDALVVCSRVARVPRESPSRDPIGPKATQNDIFRRAGAQSIDSTLPHSDLDFFSWATMAKASIGSSIEPTILGPTDCKAFWASSDVQIFFIVFDLSYSLFTLTTPAPATQDTRLLSPRILAVLRFTCIMHRHATNRRSPSPCGLWAGRERRIHEGSTGV